MVVFSIEFIDPIVVCFTVLRALGCSDRETSTFLKQIFSHIYFFMNIGSHAWPPLKVHLSWSCYFPLRFITNRLIFHHSNGSGFRPFSLVVVFFIVICTSPDWEL